MSIVKQSVVALAIFLMIGGSAFAADGENSKFYGTFDWSLTGTQPNGCTDSATEIIGGDINQLNGSCHYIYIPSSGRSASYSFVDCGDDDIDATVTISGNTIHVEETGCAGLPSPCWTEDTIIYFDSDYNGGTVTLDSYDEDPLDCQGTMTGSFTRVVSSTKIFGTWSSGILYRDVETSQWTQITPYTTTGDIAAGDFTGDGIADVASCWPSGIWYQDGATLAWKRLTRTPPYRVSAGDLTGDGRNEIIGTWASGIWYWDEATSKWTRMTSYTTTGDIAAGDFTGDGIADVASCWPSGLWYQDGATLAWTLVSRTAPNRVTAGDVTGDGRFEIIGTWNSGIWHRDVAASQWTQMTPYTTTGDIAAGDFTGDSIADVTSAWGNDGLWYQDGNTLDWMQISNTAPTQVTAGDDSESGLIAYYPFNGNTNDASGNSYHGIPNNGLSFTPSPNGQAALFDGNDDYIEINIPLDGTANWSICSLIHINDASTSQWQNLVSNKDEGFMVGFKTGDRTYRMYDAPEYLIQSEDNAVEQGKDIAVCYVKNSGLLRIYKDGEIIAENDTGGLVNFTRLIKIGIWDESRGLVNEREPWNGMLDELRIYNRALSEAEIQSLYTTP